jgi:hypothetical protein
LKEFEEEKSKWQERDNNAPASEKMISLEKAF